MQPDAGARLDALDELGEGGDGAGELVLPTFAVLARFPSAAPDEQTALDDLRRQLARARDLHDDVRVERREDDGRWLVLARFVVVSVDAATAVAGVDEELRAAGLPVDEVWVDTRLS